MRQTKPAASLLCLGIMTALQLYGQAAGSSSKPEPDVLIFTDGEKLIGHLESATGASVVFKSDMAGEVTVAWSKIQELHSSQKFAVIPKTVKLRSSQGTTSIPQGTVAVTSQQLTVTGPQGPQTIPVGNIGNLVDEASFEKAFRRTNFLQGWKGGATFGLSLTEATQKSQTVTATVNLVRAVPAESWMDLRSRTSFDYNEAYGNLSQPGSPAVKTSLFHIGAEQDRYLSPRLFAFGQAIFDHNVSQGLNLQQTFGGGLGFVVIKTDNQELDFKASLDYTNQRFENSTLNKQLFGSIFGETYTRKFAHGILLNEQAGITPAWNDTSAYSAFSSAGLTFPVYHRLGFTLGALDDFLNNPPPGFKKNSFQFTAGATYSF
ncbi:MAG TPA: DUF481 domain-containing protein [Bryobacteraceae bacterium]|nr:DUF481 domain-containing protein [Bryobacteraceae bacterium]